LTFKTFGRRFEKEPPKFDLIIIDEVQQIHLEKDDEEAEETVKPTTETVGSIIKGKDQYKEITDLLKQYGTAKILLLSGTPIVDKYGEFFQIMNFILPENLKYPKNYRKSEVDLNDKNVQEFIKERTYGRVSRYLTYSKTVKRIDHGVSVNGKINIVYHTGSDLQKVRYVNYSSKLTKGGYNTELEHPLLFVWPDGSTGEDGLTNNCISLENDVYKRYLIKDKLIDNVKQNLKEYSILYYDVLNDMGISSVSDPKSLKESCYFYNHTVSGSGNVLFAAIVESVFHYKHITNMQLLGGISNLKEGNRYALVSTDYGVTKSNEITALAEIFSHPRNTEGKLLKLIIGSDRTILGYNFKNGRQAHAVIGYNSPTLEQAVSRIIRGEAMSHVGEDRYVKVSKHAVKLEGLVSRHESNIAITIQKDTSNALLYNIIDKASIDCHINKPFFLTIPDYSRDCNFLTCKENFDCFGESKQVENAYGNYTSFYRKQREIKQVKKKLTDYLHKGVKSIHIDDVINDIGRHPFLLLDSIHNIITCQTYLLDRLGFRTYVHHYKNILFFYNKPLYKDIENLFEYVLFPKTIYPNIDRFVIDEAFLINKDKEKILRLRNDPTIYSTLNPHTQSLSFELSILSNGNLLQYILHNYRNSIINLSRLGDYNLNDLQRNLLLYFQSQGYSFIQRIVYDYYHRIFDSKVKSDGGIRALQGDKWSDLVLLNHLTITQITPKVLVIQGLQLEQTKYLPTWELYIVDGKLKFRVSGGIGGASGERKMEHGREVLTGDAHNLQSIFTEMVDLIDEEVLKQKWPSKIYEENWNIMAAMGAYSGIFNYKQHLKDLTKTLATGKTIIELYPFLP
jgi:hypothetical protein